LVKDRDSRLTLDQHAMTTLSPTVVPPDLIAAAVPTAQAGPSVSWTDMAAFDQAMASAGNRLQARAVNPSAESLRALFLPLNQINQEAATLSQHARAAVDSGSDMSPGEMVMLTVKCHEFLFHSQLTANVANRTSDGLQQLFRQQA
jgi:hypothetical protein